MHFNLLICKGKTLYYTIFFFIFSTESITKRAVREVHFKSEDIFIPSDPREVDGNVVVECAVVKESAGGKPVVVPRKVLAEMIEKKAAEIGQRLGGNVLGTQPKPAPIKHKTSSETRAKRQSAGLIAGVTIAVGLTVIIAMITIWHFRLERNALTNLLYISAITCTEYVTSLVIHIWLYLQGLSMINNTHR